MDAKDGLEPSLDDLENELSRTIQQIRSKLSDGGEQVSYPNLAAYIDDEASAPDAKKLTPERAEAIGKLVFGNRAWFDAYYETKFELDTLGRIEAADDGSEEQAALIEFLGRVSMVAEAQAGHTSPDSQAPEISEDVRKMLSSRMNPNS